MAQIKKLPIRTHDTAANRNVLTARQRMAGALVNAGSRGMDRTQRMDTRAALEQVIAEENAMTGLTPDRRKRERRALWEQRLDDVAAWDDPIAKLRRDTQRQTQAFARQIRRGEIVAVNQGNAEQRQSIQAKKMSAMNKAHVESMVFSAMQPLRQGVSLNSVLQVTGMMAGLYLASPRVREHFGAGQDSIIKGLRNKIQDRKSSHLDEKALRKLDRSESTGAPLSERWQRRLEKMEASGPGGRVPFTAQSAAMVEIGLAESAYAAMRDPSVPAAELEKHRQEIMDSYVSAMGVLNRYIAEDGIDREEVSRASRVLVGQRMTNEPALAAVFTELGHGRFVRSEGRTALINGVEQQIWTGEFTDAVTDRDVAYGSFSLRLPGGRGDHLEACAVTLEAELEDANSLEGLNEIFGSYTAASVVRQYPDVVHSVSDRDTRLRMQRAGSMFASMRADGVSQSDQRFIYGAAFVNAMENVKEKKPELVAQWEAQFGPDWQESVQGLVQDYSEMGVRAENSALVAALVDRGFDPAEASAEVEGFRAQQAQDPDAGPLLQAEAPLTIDQDAGPPETFSVSWPQHADLEPADKARLLLDKMSDWVADDLTHEVDRAGWYEPGATEKLSSPASGREVYVPASLFLNTAMGDYRRMGALVTRGNESLQPGYKRAPDMSSRQTNLALMSQEMTKLGIPLSTQDAMMSAAYVNGVEKTIERAPWTASVIEAQLEEARVAGPNWRDNLYGDSLTNTATYRQGRDPQYRTFGRHSAEQVTQRMGASHEGYSAWQREFDRLDEVEVAGQAKVGELDTAGSDSVRDRAEASVGTAVGSLADSVAASAAAREQSIKRKAVRKNLAYIEQETGDGVFGIGHDDVRILQDGDSTPGREFGG